MASGIQLGAHGRNQATMGRGNSPWQGIGAGAVARLRSSRSEVAPIGASDIAGRQHRLTGLNIKAESVQDFGSVGSGSWRLVRRRKDAAVKLEPSGLQQRRTQSVLTDRTEANGGARLLEISRLQRRDRTDGRGGASLPAEPIDRLGDAQSGEVARYVSRGFRKDPAVGKMVKPSGRARPGCRRPGRADRGRL